MTAVDMLQLRYGHRSLMRMKPQKLARWSHKRLVPGWAFQAWDGSGLVVLPDMMSDS